MDFVHFGVFSATLLRTNAAGQLLHYPTCDGHTIYNDCRPVEVARVEGLHLIILLNS